MLHFMSSLPLTNYLRTSRKRLALTQNDVAFLLGLHGISRGAKVCRDENFVCEPSLRTAFAYEVIYQTQVRDLFAGLKREIEREIAERAKILTLQKDMKQTSQKAIRLQVLTRLAIDQSLNSSQK